MTPTLEAPPDIPALSEVHLGNANQVYRKVPVTAWFVPKMDSSELICGSTPNQIAKNGGLERQYHCTLAIFSTFGATIRILSSLKLLYFELIGIFIVLGTTGMFFQTGSD